MDSWAFEELTNPSFNIVEWAAKSRNRGLMVAARSSDAQLRLPKVLSIGVAISLYDHWHTETSGGATDRRTAIDIEIIRSGMRAQGATVRWVDHGGMYADAMRCGQVAYVSLRRPLSWKDTKRQPSSRSSSFKTRVDPAAQSNNTLSESETRWSGNARHVHEAQNQKKILGSYQHVCAFTGSVGLVSSVHTVSFLLSLRRFVLCPVFLITFLRSVAILSPGPLSFCLRCFSFDVTGVTRFAK